MKLRKEILAMGKDNQKLYECNADLENIKDEIADDNKRLLKD
jgi:hypothetical protein